MTDNKLLRLFDSLSGVEKRECSKLLKSPYFNQKPALIALWDYLIAWKKQKKTRLPSPESVWAGLFPDAKFSDKKWRHLQSLLIAQIEQLLVHRDLTQHPLQSDLLVAPLYRKRKQKQALAQVFRRADEKLKKLPKDTKYYHYEYLLQWEKYAALEASDRIGKKNLAAISQSLDIYMIASKLRLACLMESHRSVSNVDYDNSFLELLISYADKHGHLDIPIISLYYHCYQSLTAGKEADFRAFRKSISEVQDDIPAEERTTFLLLAVNFCIKQLNLGQQSYIREALDLYQTGLETQTLLSEGQLSRFAFKNIVALGLKLEDFNWVRNFIDQYAPMLAKEHRQANQDYNLARLHFAQKDYKSAMPMLAQIDDRDLLLNLDSRVMLLKMYYEMGEIDALENLLTSFRILLLRKKKVIGYHQQFYLNMLKYIKKLMRLNRHDKQAVKLFKEELQSTSGVLEKDWLLAAI